MQGSTTDVLICGAGAAGLALAIDLARRGVNFRLIEKAEAPFKGSRGKGIQPRSQEVFEDFGILDRLFEAGGAYPPIRQYKPDGSFEDAPLGDAPGPSSAEPYGTPLMVPQFLNEGVMRERLAELGHQPEFGREIAGLTQDADGVTAQIGSEVVRAHYLVGTDGGRSFVRHALGIDFPGETLGVRAIVADVELNGLSRDVWHRYGSGAGQVSLCPLAGTQLFQIQAAAPREGDVDVTAAGLTHLIAERTGQNIAIHSVAWASVYSMNARLADRYRAGRVFLAGDAAHIHPPTGGQGLNTSVQDGYNLGWKLAAVLGGAPEKLLDTYEEERRPVAASVLGLSTRLLDEVTQGARMRRNREARQLDLGYSGSSLALHADQRHGLQAGDRAPDAPMRGAAGQPTRLFSLLQGPHWTLLGYKADRATIAVRSGLHIHIIGPQGDLVDEGGHFSDAYAVSPGEWILIRPDGYVGAITASDNVSALERYLAEVGIAAGSRAAV
ncbi:MAG TPA: FAD-dependent oxidoreductase [Acetobacteraceae bacterium]|nr:FAD-dependent oxidoreductase [Acetobacteraceae bacterium]